MFKCLPLCNFMYYVPSLTLERILKSARTTRPISNRRYYYFFRCWSAKLIETTRRWLNFILETVRGKKKTNWCLEVSGNLPIQLKFCSCCLSPSSGPSFFFFSFPFFFFLTSLLERSQFVSLVLHLNFRPWANLQASLSWRDHQFVFYCQSSICIAPLAPNPMKSMVIFRGGVGDPVVWMLFTRCCWEGRVRQHMCGREMVTHDFYVSGRLPGMQREYKSWGLLVHVCSEGCQGGGYVESGVCRDDC